MIRYGIDVSHHQSFPLKHDPKKPGQQSWEKLSEGAGFCICRSSYGTMRDRKAAEHMRAARSVGMVLGAYHFFRISQSVPAQFEVMRSQLVLAGYGEPGDIIPAIDVEEDPFPTRTAVSEAWADAVQLLLELTIAEYGDAMVYITQREFGMLGKPAWLLERPLWVAHYTGAAKPATPGNAPCQIWQHRVGPFVANGPGGYVASAPLLDQNRLLGELPLLGQKATAQPATPSPEDDGLEDAIHRWLCAEHDQFHQMMDDDKRKALSEDDA